MEAPSTRDATERRGVTWSRGSRVVVEVHPTAHVGAVGVRDARAPRLERALPVGRGSARPAFVHAQVHPIRGLDERTVSATTVPPDERGTVAREHLVDVVVVPTRIAHLNRDVHPRPERLQRRVETLRLALEAWRELQQDRTQLRAEQPRTFHQQLHGLLREPQSLHVREVAAGLHREPEVGRCRRDPAAERLLGGQSVERVVDLDRVEELAVADQPARLRKTLGVDVGSPVVVLPPRRADARRPSGGMLIRAAHP